jgi:restriction endonuclease S subunit
MHYLNTVDYSAFITGSTRDKLTQQEMGEIPVPLPPLEIQQEIEQRIDLKFALLNGLTDRIREQVNLLEEHRQALITAAVTGQLEVTKAA